MERTNPAAVQYDFVPDRKVIGKVFGPLMEGIERSKTWVSEVHEGSKGTHCVALLGMKGMDCVLQVEVCEEFVEKISHSSVSLLGPVRAPVEPLCTDRFKGSC